MLRWLVTWTDPNVLATDVLAVASDRIEPEQHTMLEGLSDESATEAKGGRRRSTRQS